MLDFSQGVALGQFDEMVENLLIVLLVHI
jgi:hypothetical protein